MARRQYILFVFYKITPYGYKFGEITIKKLGFRKLLSKNYFATNRVIKTAWKFSHKDNKFVLCAKDRRGWQSVV